MFHLVKITGFGLEPIELDLSSDGVRAHNRVCIIGRAGCGKTTTLRALALACCPSGALPKFVHLGAGLLRGAGKVKAWPELDLTRDWTTSLQTDDRGEIVGSATGNGRRPAAWVRGAERIGPGVQAPSAATGVPGLVGAFGYYDHHEGTFGYATQLEDRLRALDYFAMCARRAGSEARAVYFEEMAALAMRALSAITGVELVAPGYDDDMRRSNLLYKGRRTPYRALPSSVRAWFWPVEAIYHFAMHHRGEGAEVPTREKALRGVVLIDDIDLATAPNELMTKLHATGKILGENIQLIVTCNEATSLSDGDGGFKVIRI